MREQTAGDPVTVRPGGVRPVRVAIVSRVRAIREALARNFTFDEGCVVVASSSRDSIGPFGDQPRVALVDGSSISAASSAVQQLANVRIAVFGLQRGDIKSVMAWMHAGACVCLDAEEPLTRLMPAVRAAANGEVMCTSWILECVVREMPHLADGKARDPLSNLTAREHEIAALIARGFSNARIASYLQVSLSTVKNHVQSILKKLRVSGRSGVIPLIASRDHTPEHVSLENKD